VTNPCSPCKIWNSSSQVTSMPLSAMTTMCASLSSYSNRPCGMGQLLRRPMWSIISRLEAANAFSYSVGGMGSPKKSKTSIIDVPGIGTHCRSEAATRGSVALTSDAFAVGGWSDVAFGNTLPAAVVDGLRQTNPNPTFPLPSTLKSNCRFLDSCAEGRSMKSLNPPSTAKSCAYVTVLSVFPATMIWMSDRSP